MVIDFDPIIFSIPLPFELPVLATDSLNVSWYGFMYVIGFINGTYVLKYLVKNGYLHIKTELVDSLVTHSLVGMFLGARIFYVFVYNWDYYSQNLHEFFAVTKGGLSFHGAIIGIMIAGLIFARKNRIKNFELLDCLCIAGAQGIFFGRIGNFINGELYGRVTSSPLGLIFKNGGPYPRHASMLYEGILEGVVLFLLLLTIQRRTKYYGYVSGVFLLGYGVFRFVVEFFREPDSQLGYFLGWMTMGQILCSVMIVIGLGLLKYVHGKKDPIAYTHPELAEA